MVLLSNSIYLIILFYTLFNADSICNLSNPDLITFFNVLLIVFSISGNESSLIPDKNILKDDSK